MRLGVDGIQRGHNGKLSLMTTEIRRENPRLMHVDDDPAIRAMVREIVVDVVAGSCEFLECGDGGEALRLYPIRLPDLVLMDLDMRPVDGLAATRAIRAQNSQARVVILTNHDTPRFRRAAREAGACAYVLKDDLQELTGILESLPARRRASDSR